MNLNFRIVFVIITVSSVIGLIVNFISPDGIPLIAKEKKLIQANLQTKVSFKKNHKEKNLTEPASINIEQSKKLYDENVLFIDAREKEEYESAHIKGAINIPFYNFDEYKHQLNNVKKSRVIVAYCGGTDCELSILLGNKLFELDYKKTYIFFGGWNDWLAAKYPVETERK